MSNYIREKSNGKKNFVHINNFLAFQVLITHNPNWVKLSFIKPDNVRKDLMIQIPCKTEFIYQSIMRFKIWNFIPDEYLSIRVCALLTSLVLNKFDFPDENLKHIRMFGSYIDIPIPSNDINKCMSMKLPNAKNIKRKINHGNFDIVDIKNLKVSSYKISNLN